MAFHITCVIVLSPLLKGDKFTIVQSVQRV